MEDNDDELMRQADREMMNVLPESMPARPRQFLAAAIMMILEREGKLSVNLIAAANVAEQAAVRTVHNGGLAIFASRDAFFGWCVEAGHLLPLEAERARAMTAAERN